MHERTDAHPIAEPHESTVERIELILKRLNDPPQLGAMFATKVKQAGADEMIGRAAALMLEGNFSQLPIYEGTRFVGLLTAETIARWLGTKFASGIGLVEEASVRDVLKFTEDAENHLFRARHASVFDALDAFDEFTHRGKSLDAILITQAGKPHEKPLGIVTVFDVPRLLSAVDVGWPRTNKS